MKSMRLAGMVKEVATGDPTVPFWRSTKEFNAVFKDCEKKFKEIGDKVDDYEGRYSGEESTIALRKGTNEIRLALRELETVLVHLKYCEKELRNH